MPVLPRPAGTKREDFNFKNHREEEDSRSRTFAVNGDGPFSVLADVEEPPEDGVVWRAPVHKEQVVMFKAGLGETFGVVHLLIKPDDGSDVVFPEVRDVCLWGVQRVP